MDQLLCLEITWHEGYPLSQTIFTSLHIDRLLSPDNKHPPTLYRGARPTLIGGLELVHKVLRAYCIALIRSCHFSLHLIQGQTYFEEEDFVTHLFGRELLPKMGLDATIVLLDEAIDCVKSESDLFTDISDALISRLHFRKQFFMNLADDANQWQHLISQLDVVRKSHDLTQPIPSAFSEKVQRQLATSTPPRPMLKVDWDTACKNWTKLCNDIIAAHRSTDSSIVQNPHCLQKAFWAFSSRVGWLSRLGLPLFSFSMLTHPRISRSSSPRPQSRTYYSATKQ